MKATIFLIFLSIFLSSTVAIRCYIGEGSETMFYQCDLGNSNTTYNRCVKYEYDCVEGRSSCSQQQILDKATITVYSCFNEELCAEVATGQYSDAYTNFVCCATDGCNSPFGSSDATGLSVWFAGIVASVMFLSL